MNSYMRLKPLQFALLLAFASAPASVLAAGPYPSLPPALSTSVAPNIIFYLDTSASMLQDVNNQWMFTNLCNSNAHGGAAWVDCVNNNTKSYRTTVDKEPKSKMSIAKSVTKSVVQKLVDANWVTDPVTGVSSKKGEVRVGLFSFHDVPNSIGTDTVTGERNQASILRVNVTDVSVEANKVAFDNAINALNGRTATPLGEGLLEITQYLRGGTTLYGKPYLGGATSYVSPIQYRCQKNFAIVVTDGIATNDNILPIDSSPEYSWTNDKKVKTTVKMFAPIPYTTGQRDSAGNAVTKTFRVCTAENAIPDNDSEVNCPAALEGTTSKLGFDEGDRWGDVVPNRFRAIRDVAKYGRVADLRPGPGNDLDGKSFDDPKFPKQNLNTYTVGLAIENPVLPAAAIAGGGKYYRTTNETTLLAALTEAVNSIGASQSNGGGLATQSPASGVGNKLFQPVFNPSGWRGELRCFPLDDKSNPQLDEKGKPVGCTPNAIANIPKPADTGIVGRNVITSRREADDAEKPNTTVKFNFADTALGNYSPSQRSSLGVDETEQRQTINYVRGVDLPGTRSRTVLLGDIIDGQPLVVSKPSGATVDKAYSGFKTDNTSRNIVLIGANDGMLHAFRVSDMSEIMGYIPSPVYPNLKALKSPSYGTAAEPHRYHVNGSLRQADVKLGTGDSSAWTTLVAGGLGQGGQGYFALDAKNDTQLGGASTAIKWEFTDLQHSGMGYSFGAPIIYNVRTPGKTVTPAVIVSNGYDSDFNDTASGGTRTTTKASALYIINAETGALIRAIDTNIRLNPKNEIRATPAPWGGGLSSPAGLDEDNDGVLDYVYAGDMNGRMWRFDLKNDDPKDFFVEPIPIFDAGSQRPITSRPAVMSVFKASGAKVGNMVLFGTGKLLTDADRSSKETQYLYGILDKMQTPLLSTVPNTVSDKSLQEQTIDGLYTNTGSDAGPLRSYRHMSNEGIDLRSDNRLGWRVPLPNSGERNVAAPSVYGDKVFFATGTPISKEQCSPGFGWVMGLNPLTGSSVRAGNATDGAEYSFIDMDGDERPTTGDQRPFTPEPSVAGATTKPGYVSGFSVPAVPTELSFLFAKLSVLPASTSGPYGSDGASVALRESNLQSVYSGVISTGGSAPGPDKSCYGEEGNDKINCESILSPPSRKAKVFSTIWREIKD